MSGIKICIDANVFLNILNKEEKFYSSSNKLICLLEKGIIFVIIPSIVLSEILTGFYIVGNDDGAEEFLSLLLDNNNIKIVPLSVNIAVEAAIIRSKTKLKLPDSMVIATAIEENAEYLISNDSNFPESDKKIKIYDSINFLKLLKDFNHIN